MSDVKKYQPRRLEYEAIKYVEAIRYTGENHFVVREFVGEVEESPGRTVDGFTLYGGWANTLSTAVLLINTWLWKWVEVNYGDMVVKHSDGTHDVYDYVMFNELFVETQTVEESNE